MADDIEGLIARAASGDREAADELALRYERPVRAAIRRRLGPELRPRVDTDDIFQSTISAAVEALPGFSYQGEAAFVGWLAAVGEMRIRKTVKHHRAAKRDPRRELPMPDAGAIAAHLTSPPQRAARRELKADIRRAIKRLPEPDRHVVDLHSFEGLTFQEIADRLGLESRQAAHHVFQRALAEISRLMRAQRRSHREDGRAREDPA